LSRRRKLLEIARRYQLPILEDNYVGELYFDQSPMPSLKALDDASFGSHNSLVIHQGTFSKALCPGLRLGWLVAPPAVTSKLKLFKRSRDLSTNSQAQVVMAEFLSQRLYEKHLAGVRRIYKERRDLMLSALKQYMDPAIKWSEPKGGMFVWAKLPEGANARELLSYAEKEGVLFSPGDMFYLNAERYDSMRLSFIQSSEERIVEGIKRLSRAVENYLQTRKQYSGSHTGRGNWLAETTLI
jgi:2-aminoadipate transaminase